MIIKIYREIKALIPFILLKRICLHWQFNKRTKTWKQNTTL